MTMVIPIPHTVLHYTENDVDLFGQWIDSLTDMLAQAAIAARLVRLELGLFGDCKGLEGGACITVLNPVACCCAWRLGQSG